MAVPKYTSNTSFAPAYMTIFRHIWVKFNSMEPFGRNREWSAPCSWVQWIRGNDMLILLIILILVLGGGSGYYGHSRWGSGGGAGIGVGTVLVILLVAYMLGMFR